MSWAPCTQCPDLTDCGSWQTCYKPQARRLQEGYEIRARRVGWMTEHEMHGVDVSRGVVNAMGRWAPDWAAACCISEC